MGLEPSFADAYLTGVVVELGYEMVVHERVAERLETVRRRKEYAHLPRGVPAVVVGIRTHENSFPTSISERSFTRHVSPP